MLHIYHHMIVTKHGVPFAEAKLWEFPQYIFASINLTSDRERGITTRDLGASINQASLQLIPAKIICFNTRRTTSLVALMDVPVKHYLISQYLHLDRGNVKGYLRSHSTLQYWQSTSIMSHKSKGFSHFVHHQSIAKRL